MTGFDLVNTEEPNVKSFLRKWRTANQAIYPAAGHPLMVNTVTTHPTVSLLKDVLLTLHTLMGVVMNLFEIYFSVFNVYNASIRHF